MGLFRLQVNTIHLGTCVSRSSSIFTLGLVSQGHLQHSSWALYPKVTYIQLEGWSSVFKCHQLFFLSEKKWHHFSLLPLIYASSIILTILSRLISLPPELRRRFFLFSLAISSPNTSPVLRADIRSSNSPFSSSPGRLPLRGPLCPELIRRALCFSFSAFNYNKQHHFTMFSTWKHFLDTSGKRFSKLLNNWHDMCCWYMVFTT